MKSLIHFAKFILAIDSPSSQVTDAELQLLIQHSRGAMVIVEIGCFEGKTSAALAINNPELRKLYSIDPFFTGRLGVCYGEWIARIHCKREGAKAVEFRKGFSSDVAPMFHEEIDFLFIDADHRYEAIKQDWRDWYPKVRNGGIIALHDSKQAINSTQYVGSMEFYDKDVMSMREVEQIATVDSLVILRVCR